MSTIQSKELEKTLIFIDDLRNMFNQDITLLESQATKLSNCKDKELRGELKDKYLQTMEVIDELVYEFKEAFLETFPMVLPSNADKNDLDSDREDGPR